MGKVRGMICKLNEECACVLEALEQAYNHSENGIAKRIGELKSIRNTPHSNSMSSLESVMMDHQYDFAIAFHEDIVSSVLRGSFVVMTCGSIETMLKRIVLSLDNKYVSEQNKGDLCTMKGAIAKKALELISEIDNCRAPEFFGNEFELVSEIRHAYAHDSGLTNQDRKSTIESLSSLIEGFVTGLSAFKFEELENNTFKIILYSTFVGSFIRRTEDSIAELLTNIEEKLNK